MRIIPQLQPQLAFEHWEEVMGNGTSTTVQSKIMSHIFPTTQKHAVRSTSTPEPTICEI